MHRALTNNTTDVSAVSLLEQKVQRYFTRVSEQFFPRSVSVCRLDASKNLLRIGIGPDNGKNPKEMIALLDTVAKQVPGVLLYARKPRESSPQEYTNIDDANPAGYKKALAMPEADDDFIRVLAKALQEGFLREAKKPIIEIGLDNESPEKVMKFTRELALAAATQRLQEKTNVYIDQFYRAVETADTPFVSHPATQRVASLVVSRMAGVKGAEHIHPPVDSESEWKKRFPNALDDAYGTNRAITYFMLLSQECLDVPGGYIKPDHHHGRFEAFGMHPDFMKGSGVESCDIWDMKKVATVHIRGAGKPGEGVAALTKYFTEAAARVPGILQEIKPIETNGKTQGLTLMIANEPKKNLILFAREAFSAFTECKAQQEMERQLQLYHDDVTAAEGRQIADLSVRRMTDLLKKNAGVYLDKGRG